MHYVTDEATKNTEQVSEARDSERQVRCISYFYLLPE